MSLQKPHKEILLFSLRPSGNINLVDYLNIILFSFILSESYLSTFILLLFLLSSYYALKVLLFRSQDPNLATSCNSLLRTYS